MFPMVINQKNSFYKSYYFETAKVKVVIDHHGSNNMYGDLNYVLFK